MCALVKMDNNNIINLVEQTEKFFPSFVTCLVANFGMKKVEDSLGTHRIPGLVLYVRYCMYVIVYMGVYVRHSFKESL